MMLHPDVLGRGNCACVEVRKIDRITVAHAAYFAAISFSAKGGLDAFSDQSGGLNKQRHLSSAKYISRYRSSDR
ncbi:hypothetical protein CHELA1G2_11125 [Hyphomicrobiales bacterium]|nr:hypothetical protein CHELA1G2_11125 [Hyphomicrobiales bacterium]